MKFLLTDDEGNIVQTATASGPVEASAFLNGVRLHTGLATQIHAVERDAGVINDAHVCVHPKTGKIIAKRGTFTDRGGAALAHKDHPGAQHVGMQVHRFDPALIATNLELIEDEGRPADTTLAEP